MCATYVGGAARRRTWVLLRVLSARRIRQPDKRSPLGRGVRLRAASREITPSHVPENVGSDPYDARENANVTDAVRPTGVPGLY